jgi:mannan endo-1,4-beta-mannosidase
MNVTRKLVQCLAACSLALSSFSALAAGIYVSGDTVYEGSGSPLVLRGINVAHAWYADKTSTSLSDIAKTGSNSVRVVIASGKLWTKTSQADVNTIISQAKANKLILILEVHDTTGYGEQSGAATLSEAVDYWISIKSSLIGQEDYVILNIGNEAFGNNNTAADWTTAHKDAITRLRAAGFKNSIMVDAPNWGQDWSNAMRDNAATVLAADANRNVMFSVHMYDVYSTASSITSYIQKFKTNGLALVIGEFAADHKGLAVDEATIMSTAQTQKYGYLGWSWAGNSSDLVSLDIATNFNAASLSTWGNILINGANGIKATSKLATIFGGAAASSTPASVAASSKPASIAASVAASSKPASVAASVAASSKPASSKPASSAAAGATCNWYGTPTPMCVTTTSGWGYENGKSCVAPATCSAQ